MIKDIALAVEEARRRGTQGDFELTLYWLTLRLSSLNLVAIAALACQLEEEYEGHILAGDRMLTTILEVIDGHIAYRMMFPEPIC